MNRRSFACGGLLVFAQNALAQSPDMALAGDRFLHDGAEARLADILAPSENGSKGTSEPFARESQNLLADLLAQNVVAVEDVAPADRWRRRVVRARLQSGEAESLSIAEALIAAGAARVRPETDDEPIVKRLLDAEAIARDARRGLWSDYRYRIFKANEASYAVGAFHIIEGGVLVTAVRSGRVYLNFGEDYRTDFTISAKTSNARKWAKKGLDLAALQGARIRVRGYVAWINGPSIELSHPMQIEILDAAPSRDLEE